MCSACLPLNLIALHKLHRMRAAESNEDLRVSPSHRFEGFKGDLVGQFSVRINDQWVQTLRDWLSRDKRFTSGSNGR